MSRSRIPSQRNQLQKSNIPLKKTLLSSYGTTTEKKKIDNKIGKYAVITSSSLQEQKQLYDDISKIKNEYDSEIEQISNENQNIKEIFVNFSAKWIQNLESKINITNSSLYEAMEILNSVILQFENKFNQLFNSFVRIKEENGNLKEQILEEKNNYDNKITELDQLQIEYDSFRLQSQKGNQEIVTLRSDNKILQDQIDNINLDYQDIHDQYNKLNDLYEILQNENKEKDDIIAQLNSQIESNKDLSANFDANQQSLINENRILKEKLEISNQMADLLKNTPSDSSELQKKSEEIESLRGSINSKDLEIEQLKFQINDLEKQYKNNEIDSLNEQIALKTHQVDDLTAELEQKNQKIYDLTHQLNQGDPLQDFVDSLSKIADDNEQSASLRSQLTQKDETIKSMQNQIKQKDEELIQLRNLTEEINIKENLIGKKDTLISDLQQSIEKLKNDINSKNNSIEELESNIKEQEQTITNLSFKLDEKDQIIDNLESQAQTFNNQRENNQKENSEMKSTIDSMTTMMNSMKEQLTKLKISSANEKQNLNDEISQLKQKCELLDLQNEEKQSLINEKDFQIEELTSRQSFYIQKMKEGDQLAIDNDSLKTNFDEQKEKLEKTQIENANLEMNLKIAEEEKKKISLELTQIEYDRNKLLEKVQDFESKFDKNLEEENEQLSQYIKDLESQILDLNVKSQTAILLENQMKSYEEEINSLKMMLDTYKKINEVIQEKLNESNKQNNELAAKISSEGSSGVATSPSQKCTIACSPFKFEKSNEFFDDSQLTEILNENENLRKEIEKWKQIVSVLKNNIHDTENDRNFYQSECGRLNSALATIDYDQEISDQITKEKDDEIYKLKENCEKLRTEVSQILDEKKELDESFKSTSLKLTSIQHLYDELRGQYKKFTDQLAKILHKNTEQEIIFQVIQLTNASRDLNTNNPNELSTKIQYFSMSHVTNIETFAKQLSQKLDSSISSFARIQRKIQLTSRKIQLNESKIESRFAPYKRIPATERKKPLLPIMNRNVLQQKDSNDIVKRSSPSSFGDITPSVKKLIFS